MPIFNYVALNQKGEIIKGKVEADDPKSARQNVKDLGYKPTKITLDSSSAVKEVTKKKAYKEAEAKAKKHIVDYIEKNINSADKGLLLLEELLDILFKQGWWFVDE